MTVAPTIYFLLLFVDHSVYYVCGSPSLLRLENPVGLFRRIKIEIEIGVIAIVGSPNGVSPSPNGVSLNGGSPIGGSPNGDGSLIYL